MKKITKAQADILDKAQKVLFDVLPDSAEYCIKAARKTYDNRAYLIYAYPPHETREMMTAFPGEKLSEQISDCLERMADWEKTNSPEMRRQKRLAELREEMAKLEAEDAEAVL